MLDDWSELFSVSPSTPFSPLDVADLSDPNVQLSLASSCRNEASPFKSTSMFYERQSLESPGVDPHPHTIDQIGLLHLEGWLPNASSSFSLLFEDSELFSCGFSHLRPTPRPTDLTFTI